MTLLSYGWSERVAALAADHPPTSLGRVVRVDADRCLVAHEPVATETDIRPVRARPLPAVGDWVILTPDLEAVHDVLPRWSSLVRQRPDRTEPQVMAANMDVVLVVSPLDRPLSLNRIERELVVAWDTGASALVVLTKADACEDAEGRADEVRERCVGADVLLTSSLDGRGLDELAEVPLPNRTVALLGASGAGKSTLANRLLGDDVLATGAVRETDHRGTHTTTARHLIPLPSGGVLLDTPGVRSLGLWATDEGLDAAFPEIEELAGGCRFRDCAHEQEPGCAVTTAVDDGALDPARLASYRKLQRELAYLDRQHDPAARAEQTRHWKQITKQMRKHPKLKR